MIAKSTAFQALKLGRPSSGASLPPATTAQLRVSGCRSVEVLTGALNPLAHLRNVTLSGADRVRLHPRIYQARRGGHDGAGAGRSAAEINNFEISQVNFSQLWRFGTTYVRVFHLFLPP